MDYVYAFISLLGGLGAFLIGFKILSENVEKLATKGLKKLFNKTAGNRFVGVGIGALATAIVQSSSATTVMVVGLVNAGVLTLMQATAMIMGANIGTTITAQIAALQAFDFTSFAVVLACIGVFIDMLSKKDKTKIIGMSLAGLGLVFLGLEYMSDSMTIFRNSEAFMSFLSGINNPFLLLIIGIGFTALVQSSSAVTTIIISMVGAGITIGTSSNAPLFLVLGANIGTCITAFLSSIGANQNAKRAALIHFMFNLFGTIIFVVILLIWKNFMDDTLAKWFSEPATQIAMFHTFFNVIASMLFLPFIKYFVKISEIVIKDKDFTSTYQTNLDDRFLLNPGVAISQVTKEIAQLGTLAMTNLNKAINAFLEKDTSVEEDVRQNNIEIEEMNKAIIQYLVKISSKEISEQDEKLISKYHHILIDLIREGEIADNVLKYTNKTVENSFVFSESVYESIKSLRDMLNEQYDNINIMILQNDYSLKDKINEVEDNIDTLRTNLINDHIARLEEGKCKAQSSGVFINLISNLERAGDHLEVVAQTLVE